MKITNLLVSVIVPTYKRNPKMIERSIKSILNQTHFNLELIVVDDSPSDYENRDQVRNYLLQLNDDRVKYIRHEKNKGANVARNTGIKQAIGDYVAFLDDDDEWLPSKIEQQLEKFESDKVGLVYCKAIVVDETKDQKRLLINELHSGYQYKRLLKQNFIGSNSFVIISMNALKKVGLYDEELESNQDYDLFLRIAKSYEINYVDEVLVRYYIHSGERISTNPQKQFQGRLMLHKKVLSDINNHKELILTWQLKEIPLYYKIGERKNAIILLLKMFVKHPFFLIKYSTETLRYIKLKEYHKLRSKIYKKTFYNKI